MRKFSANDWNFGADEYTGFVWLHDTKEHAAWYEALVAIDYHDEKEPLIKLLKSGQPVPASIAFYFGDLLERHQLKRRKARPRTPAYERTPEQIKLIAAVTQVMWRVERDGVRLAEALQDVAKEYGLVEGTLTDAYIGKHGGLRRAARHWPRPLPRS